MKWIVAIMCFPLGAFCAYGFLASFEPYPGAMAFRVGYLVIGAFCLLGMALPFIPRKQK